MEPEDFDDYDREAELVPAADAASFLSIGGRRLCDALAPAGAATERVDQEDAQIVRSAAVSDKSAAVVLARPLA